MWTRGRLKKEAKRVLLHNYWRMVLVFVLVSYITGATGGLGLITSYNESIVESTTYNPLKGKSNSEIVDEILNPEAEDSVEELQNRPRRGVLAGVFNNVTDSGSFVFGLLNSINQSVFQDRIFAGIIIFVGAVLMFLFWTFVENVLLVGQSRFILECDFYTKTEVSRTAFMVTHKKLTNTAMVMLRKSIYLWLWEITIAGGIIKHYSYAMVPFIAAENPAVKGKEVIALSRKMMDGNKWEMFLLDLSFLGWYILGVLTMGVSNIFYFGPYRQAVYGQFYKRLREEFLENHPEYTRVFNDAALFPGVETAEKYPVEEFPLPVRRSRKWVQTDYMKKYSVRSYILLFFIFSFIGWLWEVSLHLFTDGIFVNRGVLYGPWLPIYGSGGVLILIFLKRFAKKPVLTYFLIMALCGTVEYTTAWYLETFKGKKWWDYSGYFLNLDGRICAEGLLVFGLGGCAFIYILAPALDDLIQKISRRVQLILCTVLLLAFGGDFIYSQIHPNEGKGITDYESMVPAAPEWMRTEKNG